MDFVCPSYLRVDNFVSAQRAGLPESFAAHFAHKGPSPGVHRHVSGQIVVRVKNLRRNTDNDMLVLLFLTNDIAI